MSLRFSCFTLPIPTEFFQKMDYTVEQMWGIRLCSMYLGGFGMATRETLRVRLACAHAQAVRSGRVVLGTGFVSHMLQGTSYFLLSAVLAGGEIFEGCAPFGVALVGGAGSGINAAAALGGAFLGYLTLLGLVDGLRYVSAAILTFSIAFAFYDIRLYRMPWTMPVAAALMNACTGFIALSQRGWRTQDVIYFVLETGLTALCAYCFRIALSPEKGTRDQTRQLSGMLLLCAVLLSMSELYLVAEISLGRMLAAVVVLVSAWQAGGPVGAAVGVGLGLALDLAAGRVLYAMAFGVAGLAAGLLRGTRRVSAVAVFVLADAAAVLWLWGHGIEWAIIYEVFGAGILFLLIPAAPLRRLGANLICRESPSADDRGREYARMYLEGTAQAFRTLHESMRAAFQRPASSPDDTAAIFDRAADRVCRTCELRGTCWERDYITTFNALNDATQSMLDRGRGEAGDFPGYFASRCIRFSEFLRAVNEELTALLCRRQYNSRIRDSRQAVCRQYGQLSEILSAAAAEMGQELTCDPVRERRLRQHLAVLGLEGEVAVFYDRDHHLCARISTSACHQLTEPEQLRTLTDLLGVPMRREEGRTDCLVLVQCEPYMAVAGIAARKKDGETVSGDAGTWFKRPDGQLYVLLCDGMGSGVAANRESGLAVRLLEQFLKAGVETENALAILNSALSLRGEDEGGFTTVDLLQLNLFTGQAAIYKFGAAPTYVKKKEGVQRITGCSLPAGVTAQGNVRPDCTRLKLDSGDCVLMVSDGICGTREDDWLRAKLAAFAGNSPKDLAKELITDGPEEGATDDRTALVVKLAQRAATEV